MQFAALRCVLCLLALPLTSQFVLPHARPFSARKTHLFSLLEQNERIRQGVASSELLVRRSLEMMQQRDARVRAMLAVYGDRALARARQIDGGSSASSSPVCGVPVVVKANLCDEQARCNAGSVLLDTYRPSYSHPGLKRLEQAGAIIVGSTNMDEFGMGSFTTHSKYQATQHPHLPGHSAGGSSGGAAAAVAAGYVAAAVGTDTGGSVRQPAAWCGLVGLKPTYGRISRSGMWAYASSTDCVGVITTSVADAAVLLDLMAGRDANDCTTYTAPEPQRPHSCLDAVRQATTTSMTGVRVALLDLEEAGFWVDPAVAARFDAVEAELRSLGAVTQKVKLGSLLATACRTYAVIAAAEASSNLAMFDGLRYGARPPQVASALRTTAADAVAQTRGWSFHPVVAERLLAGTAISAEQLKSAYRHRDHLKAQLEQCFQSFDLLLTPTTPTAPMPLRAATSWDATETDVYEDVFTVPASLAGLPALSLPLSAGSRSSHFGLQLMAKQWQEASLLRAARVLELSAAVTQRNSQSR